MYSSTNWNTLLHKKTKIILNICFLMIACVLPGIKVNAEALQIRYGGKDYSYASAQAAASLEGKPINLKGTPGVLINDTCMLPVADVFRTALGTSYQYDSAAKELILSQNDITLKMTLNSKTAYINGVKVTCDVAPLQIKFIKAGKTKIYVPARFVAEALGYSYTWNSKTKASEMKNPFIIKYNGTWVVYKGTQGKVNFDGKEIKLSGMPSLILDNTALLRASTVFKTGLGAEYTYDSATKKVTLAKDGNTVEMTINSKTALVNGAPKTMATSARVVYNKATNKSFIMVPGQFVASSLGYKYSWNTLTKTSVITTGDKLYWTQTFNQGTDGQVNLVSAEASFVEKTDVLTLTGSSALDATINEIDRETLELTIQNVNSNIEEVSKQIADGCYLRGVTIKGVDSSIVIQIKKDASCNYYTTASGKTLRLVLCENADGDISNSSFQLKIPVPAGLDFNAVTTEDRYYENKFIIYLPGDYSSSISQDNISYDKSVVKAVSIETTADQNTAITVQTKALKGYKLNNNGDYIGVKIADPRNIYDKIIVLDAGHGGKDNGTSNKGTKEKDLNLTIVYELAREYFDGKDSTIKAYWTRYDDTFITLDARAAFAKKVGADVFVSLHMNSATSTASGLEVFYSKDNNSSMGSLTSQKMANVFFNQLVNDLDVGTRGVKSAGFAVVKRNTVPSILIELGFLSNAGDYKKLTDPDFQEMAACSIYDAAVAMFDAYPTGR